MDLTEDHFVRSFESSEIVPVILKTMDNGTVYLRSLSYSDTNQFRRLVEETCIKRTASLFNVSIDNEYDFAEEYLIETYLCTKTGSKFFSDNESYKRWRKKVKPDVAREIISAIHANNSLYKDIEEDKQAKDITDKEQEEFKKKLK